MLQFQPPGFGQKVINTSLGRMVYYTQTTFPCSKVDDLPPLIFLHNFGGGASAYEWSKVYSAFAATHHILAPDLIGWGDSAHPVRDYKIVDYLNSITEFIRHTCKPPVTVVASSLTGAFAIRLATQHPFLFQKLFLVCPSGFNDFAEGNANQLPFGILNTPILDSLIYAVGAENEIAVSNFLKTFLFAKPDRVSPEIIQAYLFCAQQANAKFAALAFLRGDLYFDLSLYIPLLNIPTVIIWGEKAKLSSLSLGKRLATFNSNPLINFYSIPDVGVLPHLETPAAVIALMQRYLFTVKQE